MELKASLGNWGVRLKIKSKIIRVKRRLRKTLKVKRNSGKRKIIRKYFKVINPIKSYSKKWIRILKRKTWKNNINNITYIWRMVLERR